MGLIYWLLLILSATLYAVPFFCIDRLWWLIFAFPLPLFWVCVQHNIRFVHGYIWGFVLFGLHLTGVFPYLSTLANDSIFLRYAPIACIMIYLPFLSGLFFWLTQSIITFFAWEKFFSYKLAIWILCLYKYLYMLENFSLIVFGRSEGYTLLNPLIPLTAYPPLLSLLPLLGKLTLVLACIATPASVIWAFVRQTPQAFTPCIALLLFWTLSIIQYPQAESSLAWLNTIVMLPQIFIEEESPFKTRNQAVDAIKSLVYTFPQAAIIITPESALYTNQLHLKEMHSIFNEQTLNKKVHIIIGTFSRDTNNYYNCLHIIHDGTIEHSFYKRHAMLLTERIPTFFDSDFTRKHYFFHMPPISISTQERPLITLSKNISFVPYICSELFFNEEPDDFYPFKPILAICNDRWCWRYFGDIMYHAAQLKAIVWQRSIIYSTFYYQSYCSPTGHILPLNTYNPA